MITKRDQDIINFLEDFHIATSTQIHHLFFSNVSDRYSKKRLKYLTDQDILKRTRSTISSDYAYYVDKKPGQIHHDLLRTKIYLALKQKYKVLEWNNEFTVESIRPDAVCYIEDYGIIFPVFIEVHVSNKFDFNKYQELLKKNDLKTLFGMMPRVLIFTDRQITMPDIGIKFKIVDVNMNGLNSLFK